MYSSNTENHFLRQEDRSALFPVGGPIFGGGRFCVRSGYSRRERFSVILLLKKRNSFPGGKEFRRLAGEDPRDRDRRARQRSGATSSGPVGGDGGVRAGRGTLSGDRNRGIQDSASGDPESVSEGDSLAKKRL